MFENSKSKILFIISVLAAVSLTRFLPHWPNFTALGAIAVFGGATLKKDKSLALLLPLLILFISDLAVNNIMYAGFYEGFKWFTDGALFIYGGFAAMAAIGMWLARTKSAKGIFGASILGSAVFFLLSNLGVWLTPAYPNTVEGLILCYEAALPFLLSSAAGDLFFCGVLFGGYALALKRFPQIVPAR